MALGNVQKQSRRDATLVTQKATGLRLSPTVILYILLYIHHLQTSLQDSLLYISFLSNNVL
jgi:hypothetical protein